MHRNISGPPTHLWNPPKENFSNIIAIIKKNTGILTREIFLMGRPVSKGTLPTILDIAHYSGNKSLVHKFTFSY